MNESERQKAVQEFDFAALGKAQTRGEDIRPPAKKADYDPVAGVVEEDFKFVMPPLSTLMLLGAIARENGF